MFWIPKGWAPYYAEWLLSFPRAPLGSISIQAWALACGAVVLLASDAIAAVVGLVITATAKKNDSTSKAKAKGETMKVSAESPVLEEKKEL